MTTTPTNINKNRRNLMKRVAIGGASLGLSTTGLARDNSTRLTPSYPSDEMLPVPKHAPLNEGVFSVSDEQGIYYWDTGGSGPTIVLLHPGRGSAYSWPYQQHAFANAGFRTIAYSRRSHQGSPITRTNTPSTDADDLLALMNFLHVDTFHIVGLAAGGFTVTDFAVSFPHRLKSITIACSLFGMWDKDMDKRSDTILSEGFSNMPPEFKELSPTYRYAHPNGVEAWKAMEQQAREKGQRNRQKRKNSVTWAKLKALDIPTFLLTGGADLYQPPSMMREAASKLGTPYTLVIPEAGHAAQWEQPQVFNQAVLSFIRGIGE